MLRREIEALPVVKDRSLVGIVESARLATALVADLAKHLEGEE
jgi:predicted transcriptional regulator